MSYGVLRQGRRAAQRGCSEIALALMDRCPRRRACATEDKATTTTLPTSLGDVLLLCLASLKELVRQRLYAAVS